jgi:2-hydroxychromene-2-carboxylate isomerase
MGAFGSIEDKLHAVHEELKADGHAAAAKVKEILDQLVGDAPVLEHEAVTDAEQVVATAETGGIKPAEVEAVKDGAALAGQAAADVEKAV